MTQTVMRDAITTKPRWLGEALKDLTSAAVAAYPLGASQKGRKKVAHAPNRCNTPPPTRLTRPIQGADNSGPALEALYRGIGSETERCPVVSIGHDPNKMLACLLLRKEPGSNSKASA